MCESIGHFWKLGSEGGTVRDIRLDGEGDLVGL